MRVWHVLLPYASPITVCSPCWTSFMFSSTGLTLSWAEHPTLWEGTTYSAQQYDFKIVNNHSSKLDNAFYEPMFNFHMTKASPLWSHDCFIAIGMFLQLLLTLLNALLSTVEQRQPVLEQQTRQVLRVLQASFIIEYENWKHCLLQVNS